MDDCSRLMKHFLFWSMIWLSVQSPCNAEPTKLSTQDRKALQQVPRFRQILTTTNLPPTLVQLCADLNGRLAEPGRKWEASDYINDTKLPRHRLVWAATDGNYYVVHYESAGRAHTFHLLVARVKDGDKKPSLVWRGYGGELKDSRHLPTHLRAIS